MKDPFHFRLLIQELELSIPIAGPISSLRLTIPATGAS